MRKYFGYWWNAVLQIFLMILNLSEAAFHFYKHHWGSMAVSLAVVAWLVGFSFLGYKLRAKQARTMAELAARHAEIIRGLEASVMGPEAMEKAEKNLALVVKAVGAEYVLGCLYLKVKKRLFRVGHSNIYDCDSKRNAISGTCVQGGGLPPPEVIATMLLLLKNDPDIFEKWRNDAGVLYGA